MTPREKMIYERLCIATERYLKETEPFNLLQANLEALHRPIVYRFTQDGGAERVYQPLPDNVRQQVADIKAVRGWYYEKTVLPVLAELQETAL